jgi:hypothetical protein
MKENVGLLHTCIGGSNDMGGWRFRVAAIPLFALLSLPPGSSTHIYLPGMPCRPGPCLGRECLLDWTCV